MPQDVIFNSKLGIFTITFPNQGLLVRLSRIRESHDTISAEVVLRSVDATRQPLHIARLNLFSTQAKRTLANHLRQQINTLEWDTLVERVAQWTIAEYRKGEPVVEIGQKPIRQGSRWRLEGIIPEGDIALLFGPGGLGKSWFALACGVAVAHDWNGLGLKVEPGPVLYLDWEWGWQEHNDRLKELEAGMKLSFHPKIFYRYCSHKIEDDIETIQQVVIDNSIAVTIVDSLVPALGGAREAKENAEPLFTALRSIPGVSSLVISHTAKDPEAKSKSPYGDVFSTNRPRHVLEMRGISEEGQPTDFTIYKHKSNLPPARLRGLYPIGFRLSNNELGTRLEPKDVNELAPELIDKIPLKFRMSQVLNRGPKTVAILCSELGLEEKKEPSIRTILNRYKNLFVKLGVTDKAETWGNLSHIQNDDV